MFWVSAPREFNLRTLRKTIQIAVKTAFAGFRAVCHASARSWASSVGISAFGTVVPADFALRQRRYALPAMGCRAAQALLGLAAAKPIAQVKRGPQAPF